MYHYGMNHTYRAKDRKETSLTSANILAFKYFGIQIFPILKLSEIQAPKDFIPEGPLVHWLKATASKVLVMNSSVIGYCGNVAIATNI